MGAHLAQGHRVPGRRVNSARLSRQENLFEDIAKTLGDPRKHGYPIEAIHAEPMSRRVVFKFGSRDLARYYNYGWMPVLDMNVIRPLVPDE